MSQRRKLKFSNTEAVAAEIGRLRNGYTQLGDWSLPQACKHLDIALKYSMKLIPDNKPPKLQERGFLQWMQLKAILMSGRIPAGFPAPERILPPDETPDSAIDEFLATLDALKNFKDNFKPHPMLGPLKLKEGRRLHLIHCAHHFGFLIPKI